MAAPLPAALRARFGAVVEVPHVPRWAGREAPLAEAAGVLVEPPRTRPEALHRYAAALRTVVAALLGSGQLDADPPGVVRGRTVEPWRDRRADPSPRTGRRATVPPTPRTSAAAEPTTHTGPPRTAPRGAPARLHPGRAPPPAGRGRPPARIPTPREPDADTRPTCRQREGRQTRSADSIPTRRTRPRRAPSTDADPEPHHLSPRTTLRRGQACRSPRIRPNRPRRAGTRSPRPRQPHRTPPGSGRRRRPRTGRATAGPRLVSPTDRPVRRSAPPSLRAEPAPGPTTGSRANRTSRSAGPPPTATTVGSLSITAASARRPAGHPTAPGRGRHPRSRPAQVPDPATERTSSRRAVRRLRPPPPSLRRARTRSAVGQW
jgi:hypothetical protein